MVTEQPFDDDKLFGLHIVGPYVCAGAMVIHRLEDRLAVVHALQMQFQNIDVVAVGVQRRNAKLLAFDAVVFVIVIGADLRHAFGAEQFCQPASERTFARRAVADDTKDDGSLFHFFTAEITEDTQNEITGETSRRQIA